MMQPDFSTIDHAALSKLPTYTLPPSYRLQDGMGNACHMDPPGYPSYFTRCVYTRFGNSPAKGPELVIALPGEPLRVVEHSGDWAKAMRKAKLAGKEYADWDDTKALRQARLHRLWKPMPLEHPRVQAWIGDCIGYFRGCRVDPRNPDKGYWFNSTDNAWNEDDYRAIAQALDYQGEDGPALYSFVMAETDAAALYIRRFYPEYVRPAVAPADTGNWYRYLPERTAPEECPGESIGWGKGNGQHGATHPVGGNWCQVCGWHKSEE